MPVELSEIVFPEHLCANCGASEELEPRLVWLEGRINAGQAVAPFCRSCAPTADRAPPSYTVFAVGGGFGMGLLVAIARPFVPGLQHGSLVAALIIGATLAGALVGGMGRRARPLRPPQTTEYLPIRVDHIAPDSKGRPSVVTLRFTNRAYADAVAEANRELVESSALVINVG